MNPRSDTIALIAGNVALIVASNTPAGAGALTLVTPVTLNQLQPTALGQTTVQVVAYAPVTVGGGLVNVATPTITLDAPRRVLVTYGNEASNRTVTINGGDRAARPISEIVNIPSGGAGTLYTQQDFLTITSVSVGSAFTAAMSVGTNSIGSTPWVVIQRNVTPTNMGWQTNLVSGAVTGQIEVTIDDPLFVPNPTSSNPPWTNAPTASVPTGLGTINATGLYSLNQAITAWRWTTESGTGTMRIASVQTGNWQ